MKCPPRINNISNFHCEQNINNTNDHVNETSHKTYENISNKKINIVSIQNITSDSPYFLQNIIKNWKQQNYTSARYSINEQNSKDDINISIVNEDTTYQQMHEISEFN